MKKEPFDYLDEYMKSINNSKIGTNKSKSITNVDNHYNINENIGLEDAENDNITNAVYNLIYDGDLKFKERNFKEALNLYLEAHKKCKMKKINSPIELEFKIGDMYTRLQYHLKALQYYKSAYQKCENLKDKGYLYPTFK